MVNNKIFDVLDSSLEQVMKATHTFKNPSGQETIHTPFFSSVSLRDLETYHIEVANGGLVSRDFNPDHASHGRVEVRMGDYALGGGMGSASFGLPRDFDKYSSLLRIWESINEGFWECVDDFGSRNLSAIGSKNQREKYAFFSKEGANQFIGSEHKIDVDLPKLEDMLKQVSRNIIDKSLFKSEISFKVKREGKYLVNSEGSRLFFDYMRYSVCIDLESVDLERGIILPHSKVFYALNSNQLPTYETLMAAGEQVKKELADIIKSPIQKNGSFPVIMDSENHGVLWHEVIGHALEGHRMQDDENNIFGSKSCIFLGKIGQKVAPDFISIEDDPTIANRDGFYPYDDEGVLAQKVCLIENGILRNYLHSRASAAFFKTSSNGHARSSAGNDPVARMSNLVIHSSNEVPFEQLKENLIKECERQKEPYGLLFSGASGGLTLPEEAQFQTYPSKIFRVYRDGKMEQVRGIYVVGTPYNIMKNIIQTSNAYSSFRGECGAESGWVPSEEVAPDALVKSVEVNRIPDESYSQLRDAVIPRPEIE